MKFILGKKISMSQVFSEEGKVIPVTLVDAGPCVVVQKKDLEKDGYSACQIGFDEKNKLNKSRAGHAKDLGKVRWLREFKVAKEEMEKLNRGDKISADTFEVGDKVRVAGISKGKGFQGVVKRHGFHGASATHGTKHNKRAPGSIGSGYPEHVRKGKKMAGRMGSDQITLKKIAVVKVEKDKNLLYLKGALPGRRGTLLKISNF